MSSTSEGIQTVGTDRTADRRREGHQRAQPSHAQDPRHLHDGLGDDCDSRHLQPGNDPRGHHDSAAHGQASADEQNGRWQREAHPRPQRATDACAPESDPHPHLRARRTGQELGQRHEIGVLRLPQPPASLDELRPEEPQVRHGAAEGGHAQSQEGPADP